MLPVRRFGAGSPLVALHGFTYTGRQFAEIATRLDRTVVAPDLPGHGGASHATTAWPIVVQQVGALASERGGPLFGYSQGARLAVTATATGLTEPSHLILVSGTAGIADATERETRFEADRQTAMQLLESGVDEFLEQWTTTGMTSTDELEPDRRDSDLEIRRENTAEGLASALMGYGQGAMEPVWDQLDAIACPTLVISGARDAKFRDFGGRLAARIPDATHVVIDGAGHNPVLSHPVEVATELSDFINRNR